MAQWYVKEVAELTGVSVRTLHHYDKIGLLKPSVRLSNGYRVYSEADLAQLEQIVALKFFGFSLVHIKKILRAGMDLSEQLSVQYALLSEQIEHLHQVVEMLRLMMAEQKASGSVQWDRSVAIIKEYAMASNLAKSWEAEVYTKEQLARLAQLSSKYTKKEMEDYHARWQKLWMEVKGSVDKDPSGPLGKRLAIAWFGLVNEMYGNYPDLKNAVRQAYLDNKIPGVPFDKDIYDWIEKAVKAHGIQWPS